MATLQVDRLHARYVVDGPATVDRLDASLRQVLTDEMDRELAALPVPADEHVCIAQLTVPVAVAAGGTVAATARTWAAAIATALARMLDDGAGVVAYPRTLDALVDLVTSAARGDGSRRWAWEQIGLIGTAGEGGVPSPDVIATALTRRPALVPAVLTAAAARGDISLSRSGWLAVARAVQGLEAAPSPGADESRGGGGAARRRGSSSAGGGSHDQDGAVPPGADGRDAVVDRVLGAPLVARFPRRDLGAADRWSLAALAVLCTAPASARAVDVVRGVADRLGAGAGVEPEAGAAHLAVGEHTTPSDLARTRGAPAPTRPDLARDGRGDSHPEAGIAAHRPGGRADRPGVDGEHAATPTVPVPDGRADGPPTGAVETAPPPEGLGPPTGVTTDRGGLLYMIHALTALEVPESATAAGSPLAGRPWAWVIAGLAARLAGATADDAAVVTLGGVDPPAAPEAGPTVAVPVPAAGIGVADDREAAALDTIAGAIGHWVRTRLQVGDAHDLGWLWRRPATIAAEPGWVEATFPLDTVDTRVRRAGLDLDPEFVWWLGAVVRFRHV